MEITCEVTDLGQLSLALGQIAKVHNVQAARIVTAA